ncbi:unnamed protein product [Urochloa humidicola]
MIEGSLIDCQVSNWLGEEVLFCPMKHVEIEMRPADRSVEAGTTRTPPHRPVCVPRSRHHDALNRHTPIPALCSFFYLQDLVIFQSREVAQDGGHQKVTRGGKSQSDSLCSQSSTQIHVLRASMDDDMAPAVAVAR